MVVGFRDWEEANKSKVTMSKQRITENKKQRQMAIGEVMERNFMTAALNVSNEQVAITKCPTTMDYMFGADFKLQYKNTGMDIDGYSVYCDITLNPNKKGLTLIEGFSFRMSNGCEVSLGYKLESAQFIYRKPVLVFVLDTNYKAIEFEECDMLAIMYAAVKATKYVSDVLTYEFDGKRVTGGKRASQRVIFKNVKTV